MAKSRYASLVGEVKDGVKVLHYDRVPKVSKSGKKYTVGRLTVCFENNEEQFIDVSLDSWKKWSFIKRLTKLSDKVVKQINKKVKEVVQKAQEVLLPSTEVDNSWLADFMRLDSCYDLKHLKHLYRNVAKGTHPDTCGHDSFRLWFDTANYIYRQRKYAIKSITELFNEFNDWDKYNFYEEVDDFIKDADWEGLFQEGRA